MSRARKWLLIALICGALCLTGYLASPFFGRPPIPIPASAKWTRFSEFGYWKAYDLQVRFSAPYSDCVKAAEQIMARYEAGNSGYPRTLRLEIKNGDFILSA